MIKYITFFIVLIFSVSLQGQSLYELVIESDRLVEEGNAEQAVEILEKPTLKYVDSQPTDKIGARAILALANAYLYKWDPKKVEYYAVQSLKMSDEIGYDSLYIAASYIALSLLDFNGKTDSTVLMAKQFINRKSSPQDLISNSLITIAGFHNENEVNDSAIYYATQAAVIDSIRKDSSSIPYTYYDLGNYYIDDFQYEKGLEKMIFGMTYLREKDDEKRNSFKLGLGAVYFKIGNIVKTKKLALEALEFSKKNNLHKNLTGSYQNLGDCARYEGNYEAALDYYMKADSVNNIKLNHKWRGRQAKLGRANTKVDLGIKLTQNEVNELQELRNTASSDRLKNQFDFLFLRIEDNLVSDFEKKYQILFDQSEAKKADHMLVPLLNIKKEFYNKKGEYKKAFLVDKDLEILNKKISQENNKYIIQELEAVYNKNIQDQEIKYLDEQNQIKSKVVAQQRNAIIGGGIALVTVSVLLFFLYRLFRKVNAQKEIISKALTDKDILIKEIHHRVKNNLQLVSSLLTLQSRGIDDVKAKEAIQDGKSRVRSMALIHQDLYKKEALKDINVKDYIEKLTKDLFMTYKVNDQDVTLNLDIEDIDLDVDTIVPLGLIINELITNSLKYAFIEGKKGELTVSMKGNDKEFILEISDNGIGFDSNSVRDDSFGTTMISALTRQLNGKLSTKSEDGTTTQLTMPK